MCFFWRRKIKQNNMDIMAILLLPGEVATPQRADPSARACRALGRRPSGAAAATAGG